MKIIFQSIVLIVWMVLTIILAISFIGIMCLDVADGTESWFKFPSKVLDR